LNRYWTPYNGFYQGISDSVTIATNVQGDLLPTTGIQPFYAPSVGPVIRWEPGVFGVNQTYHLVMAGIIEVGVVTQNLTIEFAMNATVFLVMIVKMDNLTNSSYELECDFVLRGTELFTNAEFSYGREPTNDFSGTRMMEKSVGFVAANVNLLTIKGQFSGAPLNSEIMTNIATMTRTY